MAQRNSDLGFRIVQQPESPTADLIFIHGLNGHPSTTWTNKSEEFWLPWLGNYLPGVRVWTYGYDSAIFLASRSRDGFDLHATEFLRELLHRRSDNPSRSNGAAGKPKPIVFVAHSLGGIVVKKAMISASPPNSEWNSIFRNTAGIVFLGTPHRGSSSAKGACFLMRSILRLPIPPLLRLLRANSSLLVRIADQFNNIWGSRPIFTFRETIATVGVGIIVPKRDAITNCQGEQIYDVPNCNHTSICKPDSTRSFLFTKLLYVIQSLLRQPEVRDKQRPATTSPSSRAAGSPVTRHH